MAKIINNPQGFIAIECSVREYYLAIGGPGICDMCNCKPEQGVYIAVLNDWVCTECYKKWVARARRHIEDMPIENRNFERYRKAFGV